MAATTNRIPIAAPSPAVVWQQYRRTGDSRARDRLLFTLAPLVRHAGAVSHDQASAGLTALLSAVEIYSPDRDGPIEGFAWARVQAALASL
jgi:DNA-directed RNA polymerase specialized sigma subunit